jgi:hypothetical protein
MMSPRSLASGLSILVLSVMATGAAQRTEVPSLAAADRFAAKVLAIEAAGPGSGTGRTERASEVELESYVLYGLRDQITVQLNTVDLTLLPGELHAAVDMVVTSDLTQAHPVVGPLFEGRHGVTFEGSFEGRGGRGRFVLEGVKVDGLPVPVFLVKALLGSLDEPVDLDEPFDLPIGIEAVTLGRGSVSAVY